MRTTHVSAIDNLLEQYLKDCLSLDLQSVLGRIDNAVTSWHSADGKIVRYMDVSERWSWLVGGLTQDEIALVLNESLAKAFRHKSKRVSTKRGSIEVQDEGTISRMSESELARCAGLSVYQYRRRLTKARTQMLTNIGQRMSRAA